ncbi:trypsin-like peptidase domain-containing protein [Streptomyces fungicidicus]|uniref:VMAP-C domain-containing protein n=1 Tax=Streptomyces fungicidicus TaxID=68203 RepID=UPI003D70A145
MLELDEPAPEWARPVVWREMADGMSLRAWHGGGESIAYADVVAGPEGDGCRYLDGSLAGAAIGPGYSGGPLRAQSDATAVGLVVAHVMPRPGPLEPQMTVRRSWAMPWQTIRQELMRAGAGDVLDACAVALAGSEGLGGTSELSAEVPRLLPALRALLDDPVRRVDHCRVLAAGMGCVPPPADVPTLDELAALVVTEGRALATLTESLAPTVGTDTVGRQVLNDLLAFGRLDANIRLLSIDEHRQLLAVLRSVTLANPALIPRAAREALRFLTLPSPLASAARLNEEKLDDVVLSLEDYPDGSVGDSCSPPVPALLRLAEFVAAAAPDADGYTLRMWCERVAGRLGISDGALKERRADAAAWASQRPSPVGRIVTRLTEAGADTSERYFCEIWVIRRDGTYTAVTTTRDPLSPTSVGRLIRETADVCRDDDGDPVLHVDVVVNRDGLQIPVDSWDTGNELDDVFPELNELTLPLGTRYQVALRPDRTCRARAGESEMRRRWDVGDHSTLVVDRPSVTVQELYEQLKTSHRDTARVVLCGPPQQRDPLLLVCLAMGVPVVLWDRAADSHDDASRLGDLDPTGPLHKLPQRLQEFRAIIYGSAHSSAVRPVLVWDDCQPQIPGPLELADPS